MSAIICFNYRPHYQSDAEAPSLSMLSSTLLFNSLGSIQLKLISITIVIITHRHHPHHEQGNPLLVLVRRILLKAGTFMGSAASQVNTIVIVIILLIIQLIIKLGLACAFQFNFVIIIKNFTASFTKIYQQQWQHITMFSITALRNLLQFSILPIICFTDPFQRIEWFPKMCLRPNSCVSRFLKQEKSQKSCPHPPTHIQFCLN